MFTIPRINRYTFLAGLCLLTLVAPGCKKSAPPTTVSPGGVVIDMPKLKKDLASAPPDVQASLGTIAYCVRYTDYTKAQSELEKIAANPGLTPTQKTTVNEVIEEVKQAAASTPPAH